VAGPPIGRRLREARKRRGLSLGDLAERSGLTKGFLSQVERDLRAVNAAAIGYELLALSAVARTKETA
jgi:transcriptional regulator with XRE-family HTH domain